MPRQAHGRSLLRVGSSKPAKRKPQRSAALNALETAERQNPDVIKVRQYRLGEVEDDSDEPQTRADDDERSSKRRKTNNAQQEQENDDGGSDLEGGTWHVGVNEDDEDSDLDSDEAFGESDEEKFADFTFRGSAATNPQVKQRKIKKPRAVNLDEVDEDSDEGSDSDAEDELGDEAVDLATAWDMDDAKLLEQENGSNKKSVSKSSRTKRHGTDSGDSDGASENSNSDDSEEDESQFSVSEDDLGDTTGLRTFVEGLSSGATAQVHKDRDTSKSLPNEPSRFGLPPSKLSAADLLQYIKNPTQRQSVKILQDAERNGPEESKGGIPGKLSAPLARRQQDRLDRVAAYEKSKETLNRWIDTVKQNRRADHISFPLSDHTKDSALGQKQLMPTSQSAPANHLEATINEIMQESGMNSTKGQTIEDQEQAFEELAEKKMDIEEVKARRAELRMARDLMFREEVRARRIKKIKSKAFRRVHRKERDRIEAQQREALTAAGLLNSDDEREKQDRVRAEERMGARHRESKWAKAVKQAGRATWDEDARAGVSDLARRDEELRRRIQGKGDLDSDASNGDSESESDYDADTDTERRKFDGRLDALELAGSGTSTSKVGQMAFMQRAEAARKARNDEEVRQLRLAMDNDGGALEADEEEAPESIGRQKFGVRSSQAKGASKRSRSRNEFEAPLSESESEEGAEVAVAPPRSTHASSEKVTVSKTQSSGIGDITALSAKSRKQHEPMSGKARINRASQRTDTMLDEYTSPSESEDDIPSELNPDEAKAALAASIFAGPDDAVENFTKEKAELVEEERDQVVDNTLPGWGSWAGAGVSKREKMKGKGRFLTTIKGVAPEKRQDAKLDRVIINEKRVKKNGKYLATELPHPFENRQQYERSLRLPVGPEWSTTKHYQDAIKPRILLKQGTVIRPIAKPLA